jgi:accessory gene regulator protein AgrB
MNYDYEVDAYHPRYTRSEYLTFEQRERRQKRRAVIGLLVALGCLCGLAYLVS